MQPSYTTVVRHRGEVYMSKTRIRNSENAKSLKEWDLVRSATRNLPIYWLENLPFPIFSKKGRHRAVMEFTSQVITAIRMTSFSLWDRVHFSDTAWKHCVVSIWGAPQKSSTSEQAYVLHMTFLLPSFPQSHNGASLTRPRLLSADGNDFV